MLIKKAVCMHEEDAGMAWKHVEYRTGHSEVRRMRRLVVSFVATIANYGTAAASALTITTAASFVHVVSIHFPDCRVIA